MQGEGFDISRSCVEIGREVGASMGADHIELRQQTFEEFLRTSAGSFDLVIACAVHRWIKMPLERFGETLKALSRPGGLVLVESQGQRSPHHIEPNFESKIKTLCMAGFERVHDGTLCDDGINKRGFVLLRVAR